MRHLLLTFLLLHVSVFCIAQLYKEGNPMVVPELKSRAIPEIVLPEVNYKILRDSVLKNNDRGRCKSLQFAKGFNLNISPRKEGIWVENIKGYNIWRIKIYSKKAYSLQIVFDKFNLHQGARLFIFNEQKKHCLGAFTAYNNRKSRKFAVSPVAGDNLIVQYEVPKQYDGRQDFVISKVNHDFIGIVKNIRRPVGETAGECNIDINCDIGSEWNNIKDAVTRIIVTKGDFAEVCTGTLINNTSPRIIPYVITAAHAIENEKQAETAIFTFNYESPYCAPLDGYPDNSISGATLRAVFDSLDFCLVELKNMPPPEFRPFFVGWDRTGLLPDSSVDIHHPQGDIKKISIDRDKPKIDTYPQKQYTENGFLKILRWDVGTTEGGSSGSGLFNTQKKIIGTLTGGFANCANPVNDYFARFDLAWDYKKIPEKQLKYWLDPINAGNYSTEGKRAYDNENLCLAFTNLEDFDKHQTLVSKNYKDNGSYWGGNNSIGITEIAERFSIPGNEIITGLSMGVGKIKSDYFNSRITVNIYGAEQGMPKELLHEQTVYLRELKENAMNFIGLTKEVQTTKQFFVSMDISRLQPKDTFVVYQSLRTPEKQNFAWMKQNEEWKDFKQITKGEYSLTNVVEIVACNVDRVVNYIPNVNDTQRVIVYPNPVREWMNLEAINDIDINNVRVYNIIGQQVNVEVLNYNNKIVKINLNGNDPGIYFVWYKSETGTVTKKITYAPW